MATIRRIDWKHPTLNKMAKQVMLPLINAGLKPVVMGGFLRDFMFDKPFKDVDIVLPYFQDLDQSIVHEDGTESNCLQSNFTAMKAWFGKEEYNSTVFRSDTVEYQTMNLSSQGDYKVGDYDVNLCIWNVEAPEVTPKTVAEYIDLGICKVASSIRETYIDPSFYEDAKDEYHTLHRYYPPFIEGIRAHYERIKHKYPWPVYKCA